jgi:hypothetical protein
MASPVVSLTSAFRTNSTLLGILILKATAALYSTDERIATQGTMPFNQLSV